MYSIGGIIRRMKPKIPYAQCITLRVEVICGVVHCDIKIHPPYLQGLFERSISKNVSDTQMETTTVIREIDVFHIAQHVLTPYEKNSNTGNCYEIFTYLEDLRKMGLTDTEMKNLTPLLERICVYNHKNKVDKKIIGSIDIIKSMPVGNGLFLHNKRVIDILNVTQDDTKGDTSDKIYVLEDGTEIGESITGGDHHSMDSLKKCINNPSCVHYGCTMDDLYHIKQIGKDAIEPYKRQMEIQFGKDMKIWPSRVKTNAAYHAQSEVAKITADRFNSLPEQEKIQRMQSILKIDPDKPLTTNILRIVNKECTSSTSYWLMPKDLKKYNPLLVANGVFLDMYLGDTLIGKTQVKYNNGCWHYNKKKDLFESSSIHSSWNAVAYLTKVFTVIPASPLQ
jgi:hypothetical protein